MDNSALADALLEVSEALEFLEENPFKAKAYEKAARSIMELTVPAEDLIGSGEIVHVRGIGPSIGAMLTAWVRDGDFSMVAELKARLPKGYAELIKVPGLGMKKLRFLYHELGISSIDELRVALEEGRLAGVKGFTERGIARLERSVSDVLGYRGWYLLDAAWNWMDEVVRLLNEAGLYVQPTGACRRGMEVVEGIELLCVDRDGVFDVIHSCLQGIPKGRISREGTACLMEHPDKPPVKILVVPRETLIPALFVTTGSRAHMEQVGRVGERLAVGISPNGITRDGKTVSVRDETEIYSLLGMPYLSPEVREGRDTEWSQGGREDLVAMEDVRGVLHVHTSMSDGHATLVDMVRAAKDRGYSWVGISDHSRNAYYAGGLSVKNLKGQIREIDELNVQDQEFTILKGIESDILPDGSLDYPEGILRQLDFVIASIHSHMDMERDVMTERIIKAIRNPFTSVIGHPTGRLLLSRRPYEIDMDAVLEEAARHGVFIELNAHPMRLDIDWRLIPDFVARGGRVAINPDAHTTTGLDDIRYGLTIARKGLLTSRACLNCMDARTAAEALTARWS
ncbi:MAG TPA: PHP domain-containing protein [Deltaproteobacteria bacterium]|mgnify:CR=1 FL=1|nr:PHP domain-containing protein [Deltaproteobacteria bacterium]HPR54351.1 PHP domain-containing protein [Deltaproteobacteria bacterium]HXK47010.1 PHP domain-containing protein [Deltaproteobacteria bacterium]